MSTMSRRECLGLGALLAAPAFDAVAATPSAQARLSPDLVVLNGNVLTMDDAAPRAEAFPRPGRPRAAGGFLRRCGRG